MLQMTTQQFKDFLFDYFIEWERKQPGRRSTITAFARWLSENSYNVIIKQQILDDWMKGRYKPKGEQYLLVLAEKIGDEVYGVLKKKRPNPFLLSITSRWDRLSEEHQRKLAEDAELYEAGNNEQHIQESSKQRKQRKAD